MAEQTEKYGVENIKKALSFTADLGEGIVKIADDGKVEGKELLELGGSLVLKAMTKLTEVNKVPAEWADRSTAEMEEVVTFFAQDFEVENKEAEEITEKSVKALAALLDLGATVQEYRKSRKA